MRHIQLVDYWTKTPAPEVDRVRIQARIDELAAEQRTCQSETERNSLAYRIMVLRGTVRPLRG